MPRKFVTYCSYCIRPKLTPNWSLIFFYKVVCSMVMEKLSMQLHFCLFLQIWQIFWQIWVRSIRIVCVSFRQVFCIVITRDIPLNMSRVKIVISIRLSVIYIHIYIYIHILLKGCEIRYIVPSTFQHRNVQKCKQYLQNI